ncbi:hypothetical protein AO265_20930 [Pseudomonas sp. ABAC61]|nr:hypothetical protein AO265_20930 [Pseudomonas sp. ABAC61]
MARKNIELGVIPTGQGGDTFRSAMTKVNDMTQELYDKTAGSQPGATKNRPDVELMARANHTGTQLASTISDLAQAVRGTLLEGLTLSNSAAVAADTILAALGKLQGQVNNRVKVGDFGVGAVSLAACNDANNVAATGDLLVFPGTLNGPNPGVYGTIKTTFYEKSSSNWTQLILSTTGNKMFYRGCINGGIQPWMQVNEEFITNANGSAIKFSDGTMICWGGGSTTKTTAYPSGSIFIGEAETFTFPVAFASLGPVIPSVAYSANAYVWASTGEGNNLLQCRITGVAGVSTAQYISRYTAIGRWR